MSGESGVWADRRQGVLDWMMEGYRVLGQRTWPSWGGLGMVFREMCGVSSKDVVIIIQYCSNMSSIGEGYIYFCLLHQHYNQI